MFVHGERADAIHAGHGQRGSGFQLSAERGLKVLKIRSVVARRLHTGRGEFLGDVVGGLIDASAAEPAALELVVREVSNVIAKVVCIEMG